MVPSSELSDRKNRLSFDRWGILSWGVDKGAGETVARKMNIFLLAGGVLSQKITNCASGNVRPVALLKIQCISWFPVPYPGWPVSFRLRHDSRTLTSYLVGANTVRYKEGRCLFLSENTMAVVVLGHCVNSIALRTSKKIHLESLVLHLCTTSYPNGNHLVYTYAL